MDIYIFDKDKRFIDNLDTAISVIIAPKYNDCGDFELYLSATAMKFEVLRVGNYIMYGDFAGIIEDIKLDTSIEFGDYVTITGRNIECFLERRIVWNQTIFKGTAEDYIRKLITENCISPSLPDRKIPDLILGERKGFTEKIEIQCTYDNLLEHIKSVCKSYDYGFSMQFDADMKMVFDLYKGTDRSINQYDVFPVTFSDEFNNLLSSTYQYTTSSSRNVFLVAGEGEGLARKTVSIGSYSGLARREYYVDARDISSNDGEIPISEYNKQLMERGISESTELCDSERYEGSIVETQFNYGVDFLLGDVVTIENMYGISGNARIVEVDIVEDQSGYRVNPIFESR